MAQLPVRPVFDPPSNNDIAFGPRAAEALQALPSVSAYAEQVMDSNPGRGLVARVSGLVEQSQITSRPRNLMTTNAAGAVAFEPPAPFFDGGEYSRFEMRFMNLTGLQRYFRVNGTPGIGDVNGFRYVELTGSQSLRMADYNNNLRLVSHLVVRVDALGGFRFQLRDNRSTTTTYDTFLSIFTSGGTQRTSVGIYQSSGAVTQANIKKSSATTPTSGIYFIRIETPPFIINTNRQLIVSMARYDLDDYAGAFSKENGFLGLASDHPNNFADYNGSGRAFGEQNDMREFTLSTFGEGCRLLYLQNQVGDIRNRIGGIQ